MPTLEQRIAADIATSIAPKLEQDSAVVELIVGVATGNFFALTARRSPAARPLLAMPLSRSACSVRELPRRCDAGEHRGAGKMTDAVRVGDWCSR